MRRSNSTLVVVGLTVAALMFLSSLAVAQRINGEERTAIFASAQRVPTSVKGVTAFAAPPSGFNILAASNRELLSYGLPQAPDKATDAKGYEHWVKAMTALQACSDSTRQFRAGMTSVAANKVCRATDVKAMPYSSRNMELAPSSAAPSASVEGAPSGYYSYNWSGIANTNKNKTWKYSTSFDEVVSIWNTPVADHPFGVLPCTEGPWFEVTWNGIDGWNNGDVVQGGTTSYWDGGGCSGPIQYYGWVEWYPSYSILAAYCGSSLCPVGPGDDFETVTYGEPGTSEQYVFIEDVTQQWSGTYGLTYVTGPGVVGSSAEYIVERPCCSGSHYYPLGNYVWEFFDDSFAYDYAGKVFFPGSTATTTAIITMLGDDGSSISTPEFYGSTGNQGKYSIWLTDEGCAYSGGCTP